MANINDRVKDDWTEETTGAERIETVLETTREPTSVADFAEQALVSKPTARKYLQDLVDKGIAEAVQDGRTTKYKRNEEEFLQQRIQELRNSHSNEELIEGINEMKQQLQQYRDEYGVETPEELARQLDADEPGWLDLGEWRTTRRNLAIAQAALSFDEAYRLIEA